ncbi:MAG: SH3 domain-containing protein [Symploca sp. SIO2G7]|nr:SH3 domain-containing protein [Symploca sp. SIO2G7]
METLASIQLSAKYEESLSIEANVCELKFLEGVIWQKFACSAWINFVSLVLAIAILSTAVSTLAAELIYGRVRTDGRFLNVRSSPNGFVVGSLANGDQVTLTGRNVDDWLELSDGNYVSARWIVKEDSNGGNGGNSSNRVGYVRTQGSPLNVRSCPGGSIVGSLTNGSRISLTGRSDDGWSQLGSGKYVSSRYISSERSTQDRPLSNGNRFPSSVKSLRRGSRSQTVVILQQNLKNRGIYDGPITGYYGNLTEAAVIKFQRAQGITVDGITGPQTWKFLEGNRVLARNQNPIRDYLLPRRGEVRQL